MNQNVKDDVSQKVKELIEAPTCCKELKEAANHWLNALGTDHEAAATKSLIAELEEDLVTIDGLIAFAGSEGGVQVFGAEKAKEVEAHAREIKAAGAKYCDCPACAIVEAILARKAELL